MMKHWCLVLFSTALMLLLGTGHAQEQPIEDKKPIPVTIYVGADGRVTMDGVAVDDGPDDKELDLLTMQLKRLIDSHPLGIEGLRLKVIEDDPSVRGRVGEVFNALSKLGINSISFQLAAKNKK